MPSIYKSRTGAVWPLGYVNVPTAGNAVCIMTNVDANNVNAPENPSNNATSEYTPVFRGLGIQGYHPAANNAGGMVVNTGNVYLMVRPTGNNSGNRSDPGAMVKVIYPGGDLFFPIDPTGGQGFSPYSYFLDVDSNNDGALVVGYQGMNP